MFEIKMTINGKPFNEANFKNELEKTIFEGVVETAKEAVTEVLDENELSQITIDVIGDNIENLSIKVKGPDEIVSKVDSALSD